MYDDHTLSAKFDQPNVAGDQELVIELGCFIGQASLRGGEFRGL